MTAAAVLNGSKRPAGRRIASFVKDQGSPGEAGLIGNGFKSSVENTIFADEILVMPAKWRMTNFPPQPAIY
jgi:hypothetical protein